MNKIIAHIKNVYAKEAANEYLICNLMENQRKSKREQILRNSRVGRPATAIDKKKRIEEMLKKDKQSERLIHYSRRKPLTKKERNKESLNHTIGSNTEESNNYRANSMNSTASLRPRTTTNLISSQYLNTNHFMNFKKPAMCRQTSLSSQATLEDNGNTYSHYSITNPPLNTNHQKTQSDIHRIHFQPPSHSSDKTENQPNLSKTLLSRIHHSSAAKENLKNPQNLKNSKICNGDRENPNSDKNPFQNAVLHNCPLTQLSTNRTQMQNTNEGLLERKQEKMNTGEIWRPNEAHTKKKVDHKGRKPILISDSKENLRNHSYTRNGHHNINYKNESTTPSILHLYSQIYNTNTAQSYHLNPYSHNSHNSHNSQHSLYSQTQNAMSSHTQSHSVYSSPAPPSYTAHQPNKPPCPPKRSQSIPRKHLSSKMERDFILSQVTNNQFLNGLPLKKRNRKFIFGTYELIL